MQPPASVEPGRLQCDDDRSSVPDKVIGGFAAFIDRKSRAAVAADLPPYTTELERPLARMLAIGSPMDRAPLRRPVLSIAAAATAAGV